MNRAMFAAASGMTAQQRSLDAIADNLANADVAGFKSAQETFAEMSAGALLGTAPSGMHRLFTQGKLMKSGGAFDVALDGPGFFVVERDGVRGYTRSGAFARAVDGTLRNDEGWQLRGPRIPDRALSIDVAANGDVVATLEGGGRKNCGRIAVASFPAPERLRELGSAVFGSSEESGPVHLLTPGGERGPRVAFGMLERSNVSVIESMMAILSAQRAYEANAKGVQAADEMLRIANNIHRS